MASHDWDIKGLTGILGMLDLTRGKLASKSSGSLRHDEHVVPARENSMGGFGCRPASVCTEGVSAAFRAIWLYSFVAIGACFAGSLAGASDNDDPWQLIEFSVDLGSAVFASSQGDLVRFAVADLVAKDLWRIESIAADHVVLQRVGPDSPSSEAGVVLRRGDKLPDPAVLEPETSFYYQIHGVVIEEFDSAAVNLDGEDG